MENDTQEQITELRDEAALYGDDMLFEYCCAALAGDAYSIGFVLDFMDELMDDLD